MREYLRNLRKKRKMSMQATADHIGISRQYYQQIEAGERQKKMDITLITSLAVLFNITVEQLIEQEEKIINERKI